MRFLGNKYFYTYISILICCNLFSQIKEEKLIIKKKYEVNPKQVEKKQKNPNINQTTKSIIESKEKIEYNIENVEPTNDFNPSEINPEKPEVEISDETFKHYMKFGYGNYNKLLAEGFATYTLQKNTKLGLRYNHLSTSGFKEQDIPWDTNQSTNKLAGFIYHRFDQSDLQFSLKFKTDKIHNYGISDSLLINPDMNILNNYNNYTFRGFYDSFTDKYFDYASFTTSYLSNKYGFNESKFKTDVKFTKTEFISDLFIDDLHLGFLVSADFESIYSRFKFNDYNLGQFKIQTDPMLSFMFKGSSIKAGANIQYISAKDHNNYTEFKIYPKAEFKYNPIPELNFFANLNGETKLNSIQDFYDKNFHLFPLLDLKTSNLKYSFSGGISGIIKGNLNYKASAGFERINQKPFFTKSNIIDLNNLKEYNRLNTFQVTYDDVSRFFLSGSISFKPIDFLELGTNLKIQTFTLDNLEYAYYEAPIETNIFGHYKMFNQRLIFATQIDLVGARNTNQYKINRNLENNEYSLEQTFQTLKPYLDMNFNVLFRINPRLSVFLNGNNLLNNNYEKFVDYKVLGLQILGGFTYAF